MKNVIITIFSQNYIFFTNLALYMIGKKGASGRKDYRHRNILIHKREILLSYEQRREERFQDRDIPPDFVKATPKSRLSHPTFRLITIYSSVLSICYLHCRQGYKSCLWRIHICGSCYISSDNIWLRGLCIYILFPIRLIIFRS